MRLADSRLIHIPQLPVSLHLKMGFSFSLKMTQFSSKLTCSERFEYIFMVPFALHLLTALLTVIMFIFRMHSCIGIYSFIFGWRFISIVLFDNEKTLLTSKLTHRYKIFITMVKYKIIEVSVIRNETWEYSLSCSFCFIFIRRISFEL